MLRGRANERPLNCPWIQGLTRLLELRKAGRQKKPDLEGGHLVVPDEKYMDALEQELWGRMEERQRGRRVRKAVEMTDVVQIEAPADDVVAEESSS